jgi:hypothetical protein
VYGLEAGKKWVTPTTYDWNLTIERQVRPDTLVNISYVGLRAVHLRQDIYLNPRAAGVGTDASRPYHGFTDIFVNNNTGMSNYNALQVNFQKRPAGDRGPFKNLTLLANYTFSKAMEIALASNGGITDVGSSKGSGMPFGNPNQGHFETGPSPGVAVDRNLHLSQWRRHDHPCRNRPVPNGSRRGSRRFYRKP